MGGESRSRFSIVFDRVLYCLGVVALFFSAILFMQSAAYVPPEPYQDPPTAINTVPTSPSPSPTRTPGAQDHPERLPSPSPVEPIAAPEATPEATSAPSKNDPDFDESLLHPVKIYFVDRKVSCDVYAVGVDSQNRMKALRNPYDAAWLYLPPYAVPGDVGNAVIAGHNSYKGKTGSFSVLKKLLVGEGVVIEMSDGTTRFFVVRDIYEVPYDDNTPMTPVTDERLVTLITCKGDWDNILKTSKTRVVVVCTAMDT